MREVVVNADEMNDGDMREFEVGDQKVLLVRLNGEFYAVGGECTHFGAPLADGTMHKGRVRCPWHHACFDAVNGDLEEPPALDALSRFEARVEDGEVIVEVPEDATSEVQPELVEKDLSQDDRTFLIVGGGAASSTAAETLRKTGFQGEINVITREESSPYDRTQLSKYQLENNKSGVPNLRTSDFYEKAGIRITKGKEVVSLDTDAKKVSLDDGGDVSYDKVLLSPGAEPNTLGVTGENLNNVFPLRTPEDLSRINKKAEEASSVVVIGSSFIGMETAASLRGRGLDVTVVSVTSVPFERVLGKQIGEVYQKTHSDNGVNFEMGSKVDSFKGDSEVREVELSNGEALPADMVVLGVGVSPATGFLEESLSLEADGGIDVDKYLRVTEDVYAAGDVARFPDWRTGEKIRVEHWRLAQQHGIVAARNMAGERIPYRSLPLFWTNQFDIYLRYVGYTSSWDDLIITGDLDQKNFIGYYVKDGRIAAAVGANVNQKMAALAELMREEKLPTPGKIRSDGFDPVEHLRGL
ncbi:MAG: FAD-dependent oxidoreductase [Candidatus Bipolaricaulia bacterium]